MFFTENYTKRKITEEDKARLIEKYKNKDKLPLGKDCPAYILCKYTKTDIIKFCNEKDTKKLESIVKKFSKKIEVDINDKSNYLNQFIKGIEKSDTSCVYLMTIHCDDLVDDFYYIATINKVAIVSRTYNDVSYPESSVEQIIKEYIPIEYGEI